MKPERLISILFGLGLVAVGILSLVGNFFLTTEAWRMWPVVVIIMGLGLGLSGLLGFVNRGLGALFIPGIPVLATGGILMIASVFNFWEIWALAWPVEILAVSLGFLMAAISMRVPGLLIPASIIGVNGGILLFCNLTGLWAAWVLLWPAEFLAVGLGLLLFGLFSRTAGAVTAAMIMFMIAGAGFFLMSFISAFNLSILRFAIPAMLVLTGVLLAGLSVFRPAGPAVPAPQSEA